jgi:hypothetical protein
MTERDGTVTGELISLTDTTQRVPLEGFRDDLAFCFTKARDKAAADSSLSVLAKQDQVIGDSIALVGRALNAPGLANPRSGPLSASSAGVPDEKERARLAARAPLDSAMSALLNRKVANVNRRTALDLQLERIAVCPDLPSERHRP